MSSDLLSRKALNRATLARQMLLKREAVGVYDAIGRLLALQAQEAKPPFVALWSRIESFHRDELKALVNDYQVVRATAMRATLHLMTAKDYAAIRPTLQSMLSRGWEAVLRHRADGMDLETVLAEARAFFAQAPATFDSLRVHLEKSNPDRDIRAAAYAARLHLPLIQLPDDAAPWGYPSAAKFALATGRLDIDSDTAGNLDELVFRYLAAFGPASASDMQAWTGLKGLSAVFKRLQPQLQTFRDERGRGLFDLLDAPRPDPDTPAPVRFLPDFDNVLLGHADRTRFIDEVSRKKIVTRNLRVVATFLVDGFVAGTWKIERKKANATLVIELFETLRASVKEDLAVEGEGLLGFVEPDATACVVRFDP